MNKQQLANRIWASANNMRNKIDANEYKDYILGLIFYKFLSDTEVKYFTEVCDWEEDELCELVENYEDMNMKNAIAECQEHIGFFIDGPGVDFFVKPAEERNELRLILEQKITGMDIIGIGAGDVSFHIVQGLVV